MSTRQLHKGNKFAHKKRYFSEQKTNERNLGPQGGDGGVTAAECRRERGDSLSKVMLRCPTSVGSEVGSTSMHDIALVEIGQE